MMKNIKLRKVFAIIALFAMTLTIVPVSGIQASDVTLTLLQTNFNVKNGESISLKACYSCINGVKVIALTERSIQLPAGLTANVTVSATGNVRDITLSNITAAAGTYTVVIPSGTARSSSATDGRANAASFTIKVEGEAPTLTLSAPNPTTINEGESVSFVATYANTTLIALSERSIQLSNGLTADISVSGTGNTRTITLSNVKGNINGNTIYIPSGTGRNANSVNGRTNEVLSSAFNVNAKVVPVVDDVAPVLSIVGPNLGKIYAGETVSYVLNFTDNIAVTSISLKDSDIKLVGFTADVKITGEGNAQRTVTLSNVQGEVGKNKYISVIAGVAKDAAGNGSNAADSQSFEVIAKPVEQPTEQTKPVVPPAPVKPSDWKDNPNTGINI